ncbi:hypothetical protein EON63_09785 [archaeon]|nr:MAG: hypothetical protein EON63_09785 [archaeon]
MLLLLVQYIIKHTLHTTQHTPFTIHHTPYQRTSKVCTRKTWRTTAASLWTASWMPCASVARN